MTDHSTILPQSQGAAPAAQKELLPSPEQFLHEPGINFLQKNGIQCKLSIGASDDPLEQEADAMAGNIMRMPEQPFIRRKCDHCDEEENLQRKPLFSFIQRKESSPGSVASDAISSQVNATRGSGSNMDAQTQNFMQSRLGTDLNDVKIHTGAESTQMNRDLNSKAFTVGNDIYFNEGQYSPDSMEGKHLLAHELTHTVQQGSSTIHPKKNTVISFGNLPQTAIQKRSSPDDQKLYHSIKAHEVYEENINSWEIYHLEDVLPLRDITPETSPTTYANRTYDAQKIINKAGIKLYGKKIKEDGIFGPRTLILLRNISIDESLSATRFALQGLGFDLASIASDKGVAAATLASVKTFQVHFLKQWDLDGSGEMVFEHITDYERESTITWYDNIIFGGPAPANLVNNGFTLGDRHAILKKAYKDIRFKGRIALAEVRRNFLDIVEDNRMLVTQDAGRSKGNQFWVSYKAETKSYASKLEGWFPIEYPDRAAEDIRKNIGVTIDDGKEKITGILLDFYIPDLTVQERARLLVAKNEYLQEKADNTEDFMLPRMYALIQMINDTDKSDFLLAFDIEDQLNGFFAHAEIFEQMATLMEKNPDKNYFEALIKRTLQLKKISTLQVLMQLCNQTRFKTYTSVVKANEVLHGYKHNVQSHDYVTGTEDQQGVRLEKSMDDDAFLKVGDVTSGIYRISETRERLKEGKRAVLQAKMEELMNRDIAASLNDQTAPGGNGKDEKAYMEGIFEEASKTVKITQDDIEEVTYQEAFRLKGVKSAMINGVEEIFVAYERVARIKEDGPDWQVTEPNTGYDTRFGFENALGWYRFANMMKTIETLITIEVIILGGVAFVLSGAGPVLIAIGGGAKIVTLSITISVLIYAFTAEHHTVEGFFMAVLTGYLMALGFKLFTPVGASVAKWVGTATFRQKVLSLMARSIVTGGNAMAFTNVSSMLVEDILKGKFHSIGDYLKHAAFGFLLGAMFELGGSFIIGPAFKAVGRNVLEKITNAAEFIAFLKISGIVLKPGELASEISKSFAGFMTWMKQNLKPSAVPVIAADVRSKLSSLATRFFEGIDLAVHNHALELIEKGMTRESVDALEKIIAQTRASLGKEGSRKLLDDMINQLVKEPKRVDPFFSLVNAADKDIMAIFLKDNNLSKLASSDGILSVAQIRPPAEINNLLRLQFESELAKFEPWAQRMLRQKGDVQKQVFDLLSSRGASVSPESLLRVVETGTVLTTEVLDGLTRMVSEARKTAGSLAKVEEMLKLISDDKMAAFMKNAGKLSQDQFKEIMKLADDPALAGRLINYTKDTEQLLNMLDLAGKKSAELDNLFTGAKDYPNAAKEIESLLNRYKGNIDELNKLARQVHGDAALLERSIVRLGKKDVEELLAKGQAQPVTRSDPASMKRLLEMSEKNGWADAGKLKGFVDRLHANQAQPVKHTFENALDRLDDFVTYHSRRTAPPPVLAGHGPKNLAGPGTITELTLSGGNKVTIHANADNLQHYHEGHTFENFWFDPAKIDRAGTSTFWPPKTPDSVILDDLMDVFATNECKLMVERDLASGYAKSPPLIDTGGTKFQIGTDVSSANAGTTMFFPKEGARAVPVSKHILHAVKDLLGL